MSKQITIDLNGQKKTLEFGKFYFLKHYSEATGSDPLNASDLLLKPGKMFDFACALVYAGLKTDYKVNKVPVDFTMDDVSEWVGAMETSEVTKLISDYASLNKGEVEPELNGHAVGTN